MASDPTQTCVRARPPVVAAIFVLPLLGCNSQQSAIHPAGEEAEGVASLFWFMTGAGALIWLIVMGCAVYAVVGKRRPKSERFADRFILAGGVALPTIALAVLLVFGLSLLPAWNEDEPPDLRIHIVAKQYWWQVAYETANGSRVMSANEVHLPVGATAEFVLTSPDVIHSFWIPALGGKMDAIPGRTNVLRLTPTKAGIYRGVCAEFCGPSHALMAFGVQVHEPDAFAQRLAAEASPAIVNATPFKRAGCGGCHTIRGVSELASVGPDLTHFASRLTIAAGTLANTPENLKGWLLAPERFKPGTRMPSYAVLSDAEIEELVAFLMELR
jgi:cytochrome c oxidase subunit II